MGNSPIAAGTQPTLALLLNKFLAYTKSRSTVERSELEKEILALFEILGATSDQELQTVRTQFERMRSLPIRDRSFGVDSSLLARAFVNTKLRAFESSPSNPKLSGPAREILRVPLSEAVSRTGNFDEVQIDQSLDRLLSSIKSAPTSELEGNERKRSSLAVIRAYAENFCQIPPFCSGKSDE